MKMKKSLLSVVFLLATSSAMAAMSYSSAEVTSDMSGSVKSTNSSLLSLKTSSHHAGYLEDGVLKINFGKVGENNFGLQRDSKYSWTNILKMKNNSENVVDVTIKTENPLTDGVKLYVQIEGDNWQEIDADGAQFNGYGLYERALDLKVEVSEDADLGDFTPNLVISAVDASGTGR